jgi:hypothetical protein
MQTKQYKLSLEVRKYKAEAQAKWRAKKKLSTSQTANLRTKSEGKQ